MTEVKIYFLNLRETSPTKWNHPGPLLIFLVDCDQEVVGGEFQNLVFLLYEIDSFRNKEEMYQPLPLWGSRL